MGRPDEAVRWGAEPVPQGRREMMDSFHGQQQSYPQQYSSMPSQHQPHFAPIQTHQREQWSDVQTPNQEHPPHMYQNGMNQDAHGRPAGMEHGEVGLIPSNGSAATKAKATKNKGKPPKGVKVSAEHDKADVASGPLSSTSERSYDPQQQYPPVQDQGDSVASGDRAQSKTGRGKGKPKTPALTTLAEPNGTNHSGALAHRPQDSPVSAPNGYGMNAAVHTSMQFGTGMIMVKPLSIKTGAFGAAGDPSSSTLNSPSTPMSAKKGRSRPLMEQGGKDHETDAALGSPKHAHPAKGEHAPLSPPPPPPLSKSKSYRRKGAVSTDADIERSNEILRSPGGPSWLNSGAASTGSNSTLNNGNLSSGLNRVNTPSAPGGSAKVGGARRPPYPPPGASTENEKRKRKRLKIDDKDVREDQRSSSMLETGDIRDETGNNLSSKAASNKRTGAGEDGNERDNEEDDAMEGEEDDETLEEGDREGGDVIGARRRRSPGDDDNDQGDDDTSAAGGGSGGNASSGTNGQSRGSGGMGERKSMKRKSNGDLSGSGSSKKLKEKSKGAPTSPDALRASSDVIPQPFKCEINGIGRPRKANADGRDDKESEIGAIVPESDTEIDYLPMEDDPECPHMFGIDETDKEKDSSSEDDAEDEDDVSVKDEAETGTKLPGALSMSKKNGSGPKGRESSEMPEDIQKKGCEWVSRLAMPESAWVCLRVAL